MAKMKKLRFLGLNNNTNKFTGIMPQEFENLPISTIPKEANTFYLK